MNNRLVFEALLILVVQCTLAYALSPEQLAELSCYIVTEDVKAYDLRPLQKTDGSTYKQDSIEWNFCAYLPGTMTFAQKADGTPLTKSKATIDDRQEVKKGIEVTRQGRSDTPCDALTGELYSFTTVVTCDKRITAQGEGLITKVEGADTCAPVVYVKHAAGCTDFDPDDYSWFEQNKYIFAVIALIVGPVISLGGKRFFPYIAAGVGAIVVLLSTLAILALLGAFQKLISTLFGMLTALALAILAGTFLRSSFYLNLTILGVIAGVALGVVSYSLICIAFSWESEVALFTIVIAGGAIGGIFTWRHGKGIVVYCTSVIGSYILMRGIATFYGGFPDYGDLQAAFSGEQELEKPDLFFVSLAIFAVSTVLSALWQHYRTEAHATLQQSDDYTKAEDLQVVSHEEGSKQSQVAED